SAPSPDPPHLHSFPTRRSSDLFFDTFKEAGALAKHIAAARGNTESEAVRRVAEKRGTGFGVTTPPAEIESGTLEALRSSVQLLRSEEHTSELQSVATPYAVFCL